MSEKDFLERYSSAAQLPWSTPPKHARSAARRRPSAAPIPPPDDDAPQAQVLPEDVRFVDVDQTGGVITGTLPDLDVTMVLAPPDGDGLWSLRGRAWMAQSREEVMVVLVQDDHVLAAQPLEEDGTFEFEEVYLRDWTLEFHFGDDHATVFRHES